MTTIHRPGNTAAPRRLPDEPAQAGAPSTPSTDAAATSSSVGSAAPSGSGLPTSGLPGAGDAVEAAGARSVHLADVADLPTVPTSDAALRGGGFFPLSSREIARVRERKDPRAMAKALHKLTSDRSNILLPNDKTRLDRMEQLLGGLEKGEIDAVRAAYIERYGADPEVHLRSWDFFQPLARLDDDLALEMVAVLNGPEIAEAARTLDALLDKAAAGTLGEADRRTYFSTLPRLGLWNPPLRDEARGMDAMERKLLTRALGEARPGLALDEALRTIEAGLPPADPTPPVPREKAIAVIVSSAGAQWQELMDWALVMHDEGYHLQLFTPDGRPVAFQHDSLCVNGATAKVGFGCPPHLDVRGRAGEVAEELLGRTAGAQAFDPAQFGAVYAAGGLGFNEDVAVARTVKDAKGDDQVVLQTNPNIDAMMQRALAAKLPQIAICHGPTLYASTQMEVDGHQEPIAKGIETASLPPFESYVGLTQRKEAMFTLDVNTHEELAEMGGENHVLKDIAHMSRVVRAEKAGIEFITGPGPQAADELGRATLEALARRWPS